MEGGEKECRGHEQNRQRAALGVPPFPSRRLSMCWGSRKGWDGVDRGAMAFLFT